MEGKRSRICLDTDVVIDYLKETEETESLIERLHLKFDEVVLFASAREVKRTAYGDYSL